MWFEMIWGSSKRAYLIHLSYISYISYIYISYIFIYHISYIICHISYIIYHISTSHCMDGGPGRTLGWPGGCGGRCVQRIQRRQRKLRVILALEEAAEGGLPWSAKKGGWWYYRICNICIYNICLYVYIYILICMYNIYIYRHDSSKYRHIIYPYDVWYVTVNNWSPERLRSVVVCAKDVSPVVCTKV